MSFFKGDCTAFPQSQLFGLKASKLLKRDRSSNGVRVVSAQASTSLTQEKALEWVKKDNRRLLHVVYRVGDLDRTVKYVFSCIVSLCKCFGPNL